MPDYLIEREVPNLSELSDEDIRALSLQSLAVLNELGPEIRWVRSYIADSKLYCIYQAANEELIREHARILGIPATRIEAVRRLVDPAEFQ